MRAKLTPTQQAKAELLNIAIYDDGGVPEDGRGYFAVHNGFPLGLYLRTKKNQSIWVKDVDALLRMAADPDRYKCIWAD